MSASRVLMALGCVLVFATTALAQTQDIKVTVDGVTFKPGSEIAINVGLLSKSGRLPQGYRDATAFYQACTAKNEKDNWNTGLGAEVFCSLAGQQTKIFNSKAESVQDIADASSSRHAFAEKLKLPASPDGSKLWVIVRLDYSMPDQAPGLHNSLYGSVFLLYRCEQAAGGPKTGVVSHCGYYTPGGWAIHKGATKTIITPPHPPR